MWYNNIDTFIRTGFSNVIVIFSVIKVFARFSYAGMKMIQEYAVYYSETNPHSDVMPKQKSRTDIYH
jgi:hypothetical protein